MAVQKNRMSRSKRDKRRTHDKLTAPTVSQDFETGELHHRHHITADGYYRGKKVFLSKEDKKAIKAMKAEKRAEAKAQSNQEAVEEDDLIDEIVFTDETIFNKDENTEENTPDNR